MIKNVMRMYKVVEPLVCPNRSDDGYCILFEQSDWCPRYEFPDWCPLEELADD